VLVELFKVLVLPSSTELVMEGLKVLLPVYNRFGLFLYFGFHYEQK